MSARTPSPSRQTDQDKHSPIENDINASESPVKIENEAQDNGSKELPRIRGPEGGTPQYEIKELKRVTLRLERSLPKPELPRTIDPKAITPIRRQGFIVITPTLPSAPVQPISTPVQPTSTQDSKTQNTKIEHKWSQNETKILLDFYNKYHSKVGTFKIPNIKVLWEVIAAELGNLNIHVSSSNCINRWKVLERNYKKFVYNQNKTGRGRRHFEYEEEMRDIFGNKNNIQPEINPEMLQPEIILNTEAIDNIEKVPEEQETAAVSDEEVEQPQTISTVKSSQKAEVVLKKIRLDRKGYYKSKLELERKKLEQIKRRNDLMEERNLIMKERNQLLQEKKICNCSLEMEL